MENNIKILVIPDVHGREFWREPVKEVLGKTDAKVIFLGDYVDPYAYEFERGVNYEEVTIGILNEIIDIKKSHPNQVILLLGNHDCGYAISDEICSSRMDYKNKPYIEKLFRDNRECFQIVYKDRCVLFSHAGIHKGFLDDAGISDEHFDAVINNAWLVDDMKILNTLGIYDGYRGFSLSKYGSPVWADVRSFFDISGRPIDEGLGFQVFGHTQLKNPIINKEFACLDCREAFIIDENMYITSFSEKVNAVG